MKTALIRAIAYQRLAQREYSWARTYTPYWRQDLSIFHQALAAELAKLARYYYAVSQGWPRTGDE